MAVVTARAMSVGFRHLDAPVRWWEGPETRTIDGFEYEGSTRILLPASAAPSWSITDPTGFSFTYMLDEEEAESFFQRSISNVPVTLYRFYLTDVGQWLEHAQWRFEGVIGNATWDASERRVQCTAVPASMTTKLRPHVPLWSRQSRPDADTGFRWMRAKRTLQSFQGDQVG